MKLPSKSTIKSLVIDQALIFAWVWQMFRFGFDIVVVLLLAIISNDIRHMRGKMNGSVL